MLSRHSRCTCSPKKGFEQERLPKNRESLSLGKEPVGKRGLGPFCQSQKVEGKSFGCLPISDRERAPLLVPLLTQEIAEIGKRLLQPVALDIQPVLCRLGHGEGRIAGQERRFGRRMRA